MWSLTNLWYQAVETLFKRQFRSYRMKVGRDSISLYSKNIICARADGSYTEIYTNQDTLVVSRNIASVERCLQGWGFIRVHRSYLVNVMHIKHILMGNPSVLILTNSMEIKLPKRKKKRLLRRINWLRSGRLKRIQKHSTFSRS